MQGMKTTDRTLAILWLVPFIGAPSYWLWEFLNKCAPAYDGIHAWLSLVCVFGIISSIFLFRGAKWACISIGIIALYFGVGTISEIWPMRADKWADIAVFVFSWVSVVLLFFSRRAPVTKPITPESD
jgi:hypothetical protein